MELYEAATRGVLYEKVFLEIKLNSQENICARISFLIKLQTLALVFSYEFWEISKNTFFTEHLWETASEFYLTSFQVQRFISLPAKHFFLIKMAIKNLTIKKV